MFPEQKEITRVISVNPGVHFQQVVFQKRQNPRITNIYSGSDIALTGFGRHTPVACAGNSLLEHNTPTCLCCATEQQQPDPGPQAQDISHPALWEKVC